MHCIQVQVYAMDTLLNAEEVREVLQVSRRTFESMVAKRSAPVFILVGRQRRWRRSDVEEWIASRVEAARTGEEKGGPAYLETKS